MVLKNRLKTSDRGVLWNRISYLVFRIPLKEETLDRNHEGSYTKSQRRNTKYDSRNTSPEIRFTFFVAAFFK